MREKLNNIKEEVLELLENVHTSGQIEEIRVKVLGKKGSLTQLLRGMGNLPLEERPIVGQLVNEYRSMLEEKINQRESELLQKEKIERMKEETLDITIPGKKVTFGKLHPLSIVLDQIVDIFVGLGFEVAEGPEIEWDYYNFEALNIPRNHPARDTQDTFYINENVLLRTHTSPVQVRVMEKNKPPIRIINPGRVYRSDAVDATHSPIFHQIEGLVVDKGISMSDLKGVLEIYAKELFGESTRTKLRPHHFPFTEPSAEVDVSCSVCHGAGCRVCSHTGWIEILGAGMVHPRVLQMCGIDPEVYRGFAFGMGLDRVTMLKYGINDMRLLFENDIRFLKQF
ncbi:MAG: phenylalanine--tRNA ligase subunit alpha [Clostridia bacterium]|jgi:phenylalanyl-tRNA synthetase alpha chain